MSSKTSMDTDTLHITQETLFNQIEFSYVVPLEDLKHIYLFLRKKLILFKKISKCAVSRKVKKRYIELKFLINDIETLSLVEGYAIPFHEIPRQKNTPELS